MKKSTEIRQELSNLVSSQQDMANVLTTEKRAGFNPDEQVKFDAIQAQVNELRTQLANAENFEENQRSFGVNGGESVFGKGEKNEQRDDTLRPAPLSIHAIIRSQMANGQLEGEALRVHNESKRAAEAQGIVVTGAVIPFAEKRATQQTVTGDGGDYGGNLVPRDQQSLIEYLRPAPLIEKMGIVVTTGLKGNLRYPVNEGGIIATWEGETDKTDGTANKYGYVDSIPKRVSVTVPISLLNIMQSSEDLEKQTVDDILLAVGNAIDVAFVNGSGTGQPLGVLNHTGVNTVATGTNGSAPTWDNLVDMETAIFVENASAAKMNYLVNPKTRGKLKKTKHDAGDLNYLMDKSGEVNGYPSFTSNHVPSNLTKGTGTNLSAGIFGDFTQGRVNIWGFMDISVDDKSRKNEGLIEVTANVFVDVVIRQPKAFAIAKGWITT
ncbi:phage major capsid protein [Flavobacterium sp. 3-210]